MYLIRRDVVVIVVVVCVATVSFSLGFFAGNHETSPAVTFKDNLCIAPVTEASIKNGESLSQGNSTIVASKNGSKYYFIWCASASRISAKNRVYFETVEEAEKKGYTKASGCN